MLHIVNRLPLERSLIDRTSPGDTLLLIESAVYSARRTDSAAEILEKALPRLRICVLGPDLEARGIDPEEMIDGIEIVDYGGFVRLTVENRVVHSWG